MKKFVQKFQTQNMFLSLRILYIQIVNYLLDISKKIVNFDFLPRSSVGSDTHKEHPE